MYLWLLESNVLLPAAASWSSFLEDYTRSFFSRKPIGCLEKVELVSLMYISPGTIFEEAKFWRL